MKKICYQQIELIKSLHKLYKKFTFSLFSFFAFIAVLTVFSGCSFHKNLTAIVSLKIDESVINRIINTVNDYSNKYNNVAVKDMYLDISIEGDYQKNRTLQLEQNLSILFNDVPVDSVVFLTASAYILQQNHSGQNTKLEFYSGKSEPFTIKEGINEINLFLSKNSFISVTVKIIDDLILSYKENGTTLIFTVDGVEKADDVVWFLDGEMQTQNTKTFTLETKGLCSGTYELEVVCGQNSAAAFITIQ